MNPTRKLVARAIVATLLGVIVGYAIGTSMASDAARGKRLTMKEYIADFDHHRKELLKGDVPLGPAIIVGTLMMVVVFAGYEVLVLGVDKLLGALDRQRDTAEAPPPWEVRRP